MCMLRGLVNVVKDYPKAACHDRPLLADCAPSPVAPKAVTHGGRPGSDRLLAGESTNIHCRPEADSDGCPLSGRLLHTSFEVPIST